MFGQSLLSAFGIACTTDTDQLFNPTPTQINSLATYQLNNATTSIPSNTYPGTASNITYSTGKFGNAAVFSGNSKITLDNTAFRLSTQTISLWINSSDYNPNCTLYDGGLDNNGTLWGGVAIGAQANKVYYYGGDPTGTGGSGFFHVTGTTNITNGTWVHIALVVNGTSITGYVNGLQDTGLSRTLGANIPYYGLPGFYLGVRSGNFGSHGWFNGTIDQVRIFNTALSQTAVTALYNETTTTAQNAYITEEVYSGIAYYKMSDATDQLGNYNGTATNVNFNTEGKFGFAGAFNGSSSYIDLNHKTAYSAFTISAWVNVTSTTSSQSIVSRWYDGSNRSFGFYMAGGGQLTLLTSTNGSNTVITTGGTLTANTWHFVCLTFQSSGNITITLDGSTTTTAQNTTIYDNNQNWLIGMEDSRGGQKWNGKIDQIRMYDSALSAADVTTLYKEVECEPAAINALANFNTVLFTGNGSQSISTVGFKPGMIWNKCRSNGLNHTLFDSVRGTTKSLRPNANTAEQTRSGVTSFDPNGFTIGTDDESGGQSGYTYVSWNWKAALANLSTSFNGSSSKIDITGQLPTSTTSDYGISCWVNANALGSAGRVIFSNFGAGGSFGTGQAGIYIWNSKLRFYIYSGSGSSFHVYDGSSTISTGTWYNIVSNIDINAGTSTSLTAYINGSPETLTFLASTNISGNSLTQLGVAQNTHFWDGKMGQVRIFNDALTASEVSDLYAEPAASNNTLNYPAGAGCIAAYPLQTDAVDLSGNYSGASSNVTFGKPGYLTSNTDGTITSTVAANQEAGFSIVQWIGNGNDATVGTGLSSQAELVITKGIENLATYNQWVTYHKDLSTNYHLYLNKTDSQQNGVGDYFRDAAFSSTVFGLGNDIYGPNVNGTNMIAYCFTSIPGYSKIGSYIGTGGAFTVYTGFAPSFVMIKRSDSTSNWVIIDNKRGGTSRARLYPNLSNAEDNNQGDTLTSNGFSPRPTPTADTNINGGTFIYLAIA